MSKKRRQQEMEFIASSIRESVVGISEVLEAWDYQYEEPLSFNELEVASIVSIFVRCISEATVRMIDNERLGGVDKDVVKEQYLDALVVDIQRLLEVYTPHKMTDLFEIVE